QPGEAPESRPVAIGEGGGGSVGVDVAQVEDDVGTSARDQAADRRRSRPGGPVADRPERGGGGGAVGDERPLRGRGRRDRRHALPGPAGRAAADGQDDGKGSDDERRRADPNRPHARGSTRASRRVVEPATRVAGSTAKSAFLF